MEEILNKAEYLEEEEVIEIIQKGKFFNITDPSVVCDVEDVEIFVVLSNRKEYCFAVSEPLNVEDDPSSINSVFHDILYYTDGVTSEKAQEICVIEKPVLFLVNIETYHQGVHEQVGFPYYKFIYSILH